MRDGGPIWPTFRNHDVIPASCDVSTHDADLRRTIHPQSFITVAFIFSELDGGGGGGGASGASPSVQKIEKKPGLDRVNTVVCCYGWRGWKWTET